MSSLFSTDHEKVMVDSFMDNLEEEREEQREGLQVIPPEYRPILTRFLQEIARVNAKIERLKKLNVNVAWGQKIEAGDKVLITTLIEYDEEFAHELSQTVREFFGDQIEVLFIWGASAVVESQSGL